MTSITSKEELLNRKNQIGFRGSDPMSYGAKLNEIKSKRRSKQRAREAKYAEILKDAKRKGEGNERMSVLQAVKRH